METYVSYAIMAQLTGKDAIRFYCAPFGGCTPGSTYVEETDDDAS